MRDALFHVDRLEPATLQAQIRETLVSAMLSGQLPAGAAMPSTRAMADRLKVSRNTVTLAYHALAADGFLEARERSGFYVARDVPGRVEAPTARRAGDAVDWEARLRARPADQANIVKPRGWSRQPYPFIYGQTDPALFPVAAWRDCTRQAMSLKWLDAWTEDRFAEDDPMLVEQLRQRVLPRRGVLAGPDEILVTLGAQNALHIVAGLLAGPGVRVAVEDPGYPDARNIFALAGAAVVPVPVDAEGLRVDLLGDARLVFATPSHQSPTSVTMTLARRRALLDWARAADAVVIEDDYEFETNYMGAPTPALKSLDGEGRVLYVGSLSKSLMPGLRLGFLVGPARLIREARALRRLMLRHPPGNNQRVAALFLALGHHDTLVHRLQKALAGRWRALRAALEGHFPGWSRAPTFGGAAFWLEGPEGFDAARLAAEALADGVVIEPGAVLFADPARGARCFRLGFSSIPEERIAEGVARLAAAARRLGF